VSDFNLIHRIEAQSVVDAWLDATDAILASEDATMFNLVVGILDPIALSDIDQVVCHTVDEFLRAHASLPLITVANTIFPGGFYRDGGARAVFEEYPQTYAISKTSWGTYAGRLFTKVKMRSETTSRIERVIRKLRRNAKGSRMKASYEADVFGTIDSEEISTYCAETDSGLGIGQPCLVHLSFKLHQDDTVSLTAIYRSQYYVAKALGNFVGLAQLLAFVATEADLKPGFLVCHATMAEIDLGKKGGRWNRNDVRNLIAKCRAVKAVESTPATSAF
jgi:hypothetical protein